ncbi:hypothetical protein ABENE_21335 [Asticcacaulis benevestitus DSM 16100 = ATCC BAA-896]|uniref:Uncharacterized protein n=1 Tax=Asticcacaulis benevestitus DSM 16100 = ATCC BAA-896 TaxID=1121022 RepID=V4P164_9CAUL|nr:hypothetical protein ABENE_21335 [Asticcacaulis benevestitus DSM 16100 = ATCC BAA-896]
MPLIKVELIYSSCGIEFFVFLKKRASTEGKSVLTRSREEYASVQIQQLVEGSRVEKLGDKMHANPNAV